MRSTMRLAALAALAALALAAGGCGSDDPPAAANPVDRAFVAAMIPHHEGAIEMARLVRGRAATPLVRRLAAAIVRGQGVEIAQMRVADARLRAAGVAVGDLGVSDGDRGHGGDPAMLREAPVPDRAFLEMMIPHHEGALPMAEAELRRGGDPELLRLASAILDGQRREIAQMRARLGEGMPEDGSPHHG